MSVGAALPTHLRDLQGTETFSFGSEPAVSTVQLTPYRTDLPKKANSSLAGQKLTRIALW
jgi:hypothetical protein